MRQLRERAPGANHHTETHQDTAVRPVQVIPQRDRDPPPLTSLPRPTGHCPHTDPRLHASHPPLTSPLPVPTSRRHPISRLHRALPEDVSRPAAPHPHREAQGATRKVAALHPPTDHLPVRDLPQALPPVEGEHRPAQSRPEASLKAQHVSRRNKRTT